MTVPLSGVHEKYLEHVKLRNRAKTIRSYTGLLDGVIGFLNVEFVDEITPSAVEAFMTHRVGEVSTRTTNMGLCALKTMLNWAVESRLIARNPIQGVKNLRQVTKKFRRTLTEEEAQNLLQKSQERYRRIWYCFLTTGLRHGELTGLRWNDIDFENNKIRVRGEVSKNWDEGGIPMQSGLRRMLQAMKSEAGDVLPTDPVFRNKRGGPIRNNLLRAFKKCADKAGMKSESVDIHCLRYSFEAHLIRRGASIKTVQRLMRHKTASMTLDVYAQYFADDGEAAVEDLPFVLHGTHTAQPHTEAEGAPSNENAA